jgi:hypothetical protein
VLLAWGVLGVLFSVLASQRKRPGLEHMLSALGHCSHHLPEGCAPTPISARLSCMYGLERHSRQNTVQHEQETII